jgi:solute:Na+ symporter, SSS family
VVNRSVGSFLLLMSVFGTTMTGFALVGSTGKAFTSGIGTYG